MWAVATATALVAGVFVAVPITAEAAPKVPAKPNIVDPAGDANYLNGQGFEESQGDNVTPADVGSLSDILAVWFTHDADKVNAHIQTEAAPSGTNASIFFRVMVDPVGEDPDCLRFQGATAGLTSTSEPFGSLRDLCGDADETYTEGIEFTIETGPKESGLYTISVPRSTHPAFANGTKLLAPTAHSRNYLADAVTAPQIDNTKPGTDYVLRAVKKPSVKKPPSEDQNQGQKTRTRKCKRFAPGEAGAEAPMVKLTDKATEKKPREQAVALDMSVADIAGDPSSAYVNIQVDSKAKSAGLYALFEFPERRDYDMNLLHTDGSYAARSRSFNPVLGTPGEQLSEPGHGGEGTTTSEKLVGIKTRDCGGWTLEVQNWLGEGGDFALKLWLGKAKNAPQAPGEETP
jgi:hypothetical protein